MCGIAGIVHFSEQPFDRCNILQMTRSMAHRGPNDSGFLFYRFSPQSSRRSEQTYLTFCDDEFTAHNENMASIGGDYARHELGSSKWNLALGHRRLSIIDVSHKGHQPMPNTDHSLWLVCNGEIYNFQDLRTDLEARDHWFNSKTDSEVILHQYEESGIDCLSHLNGMFAFALWDMNAKKLYLARDRFGMKPLYYYMNEKSLLFASEIKAIIASGAYEPELNYDAVAEYFTYQNIYSDQTLFKHIRMLPPACFLEVDLSGKSPDVKQRKYWSKSDIQRLEPSQISKDDCAAALHEHVREAVRRHLISDVDVGSYLSSGMDSGSIVGLATQFNPRIYTFTNGFDLRSVKGFEVGFDERAGAEELASLLNTEHYEMVIHAGDMASVMPNVVYHHEDLRVGMCYQNYFAAKLAGKFVRVCLSGVGGDEIFGGYPWRYFSSLDSSSMDEFDDRYYSYWQRLVRSEEMPGFLNHDIWESLEVKDMRHYYDMVMKGLPAFSRNGAPTRTDYLNRALHFEQETFLHGILVLEDRLSMAHSMETRIPFLDKDLVDFSYSIPSEYLIDGLYDKANYSNGDNMETNHGKSVLRQSMRNVLPDHIVYKAKQGFSPPDENWFRDQKKGYVMDILLDPKTLGRGLFQQSFIDNILEEHASARKNHRLLIWSLLAFEWLQRIYFDK